MSLADALKFVTASPAPSSSASGKSLLPQLHIAIQGCCHGELDRIYAEIRAHTQQTGKKVDLLLCCGDFQCTGCEADLDAMAVPRKYRTLADFPKYATGAARAPCLTVFVGGNHEASNVLFEQYHGGFVAPNIYYLGHSGVINVGGLRIAGLSGIFSAGDLHRAYPVPPYSTRDENDIRSAYHVRRFELDKLLMLPASGGGQQGAAALPPIDIFMSHDWPVGVTDHGDVDALLTIKPYFADDIKRRQLGNPHTMQILQHLRPKHWFAAHLHCRFRALVPHKAAAAAGAGAAAAPAASSHTDFLALNKCAKNAAREFLEFLDITPQDATARALGLATAGAAASLRNPLNPEMLTVRVDPEWCDIIRRTHWRTPIALPPAKFADSAVEWIAGAMAGAAKTAVDNNAAGTRRGRDDSGGQATLAVTASDTMSILYQLGMQDDQQTSSEQQQTSKAAAAAAAAHASIVQRLHAQQLGGAGVPRCDDDDDEGGAEYDEGLGWEEERASEGPGVPRAANVVSLGGVLQQQKHGGDVGLGWEEDVG